MTAKEVRRLLVKAQRLLGGSERSFASAVGVSQNAVWNAKHKGHVSAELARDIHLATGGAVPCELLRPDLWPVPGGEEEA